MFEQLIKSGVRRYEEWFVTSLIIEDGQVCGVMALEIRTGQVYAIRAKTVIFATGGLGRVFEPSTNALIVTGDGMALAYNAGAQLMDMEMVQYHPTTLAGSGVLISEAARGEGAYLLDKDGNRFMEKYAPNMMELASRDVVSRAEQTEINAGNGVNGCVLLDCRHLGEALITEKLSQIREIGIDLIGMDMVTDPIPIRPGNALHNGRHQDRRGRPDQPPRASTPPGSAPASASTAGTAWGPTRCWTPSCLASGRAIDAAEPRPQGLRVRGVQRGRRRSGRKQERHAGVSWTVLPTATESPAVRLGMGESMNRNLAVFRNQEGMEESLGDLEQLQERSRPCLWKTRARYSTPTLYLDLSWASCWTLRPASWSAPWTARIAGAPRPAPTTPTGTTRTG